jgi:hypothetical protein
MRCSEPALRTRSLHLKPYRRSGRFLLAIVSCQLWACSSELPVVDSDEDAAQDSQGSGDLPRSSARTSGGSEDEADLAGAVPDESTPSTRPGDTRPGDEGSAASRVMKKGALAKETSKAMREAAGASAEPDDGDRTETNSGLLRRPAITSTIALAPLAGHMATPAAGQENIGVAGTDLGFSFAHGDAIHFLFGDTWANDRGKLIDSREDDVQGSISLRDFPNGRAVDEYVRTHPPESGPVWSGSAPPITFVTNAQGRVSSIHVQNKADSLSMGIGKTPVAGFSNGSDVFGIFHRWIPVHCSGGSTPSCDDGYTCDPGMGAVLGTTDDTLVQPCVLGELGCTSVSGGGLCQDRTSSVYRDDAVGRKQAVLLRDEFGNLDRADPSRFLTRSFTTLKFRNPAVRTVASFDPSRAGGIGNDYRTAPGKGGTDEKVFIWGRPSFGASAARGTSAKLYFSYMDMPEYRETGEVAMSMHYFTGLADGVPQFSDRAVDAVALDLSYPGEDSTTETWDIVSQMSVTWVASMKKWVMFYGGDLAARGLPIIVGPNAQVRADPEAALHVRYADRPWGPWTAPEQLLKANDLQDPSAGAAADGGILHRPSCKGAACAPHEPGYDDDSEIGVLYCPAIIEPWTVVDDSGAVDLYWAVSTWDPYQVMLMKSRLELK